MGCCFSRISSSNNYEYYIPINQPIYSKHHEIMIEMMSTYYR